MLIDITVNCKAVYNSRMEVPDGMNEEDMLNYIEKNLDKAPLGPLEYVQGSDSLDRENWYPVLGD